MIDGLGTLEFLNFSMKKLPKDGKYSWALKKPVDDKKNEKTAKLDKKEKKGHKILSGENLSGVKAAGVKQNRQAKAAETAGPGRIDGTTSAVKAVRSVLSTATHSYDRLSGVLSSYKNSLTTGSDEDLQQGQTTSNGKQDAEIVGSVRRSATAVANLYGSFLRAVSSGHADSQDFSSLSTAINQKVNDNVGKYDYLDISAKGLGLDKAGNSRAEVIKAIDNAVNTLTNFRRAVNDTVPSHEKTEKYGLNVSA